MLHQDTGSLPEGRRVEPRLAPYRFQTSHRALLPSSSGDGSSGPLLVPSCDAVVVLNHLHPARLSFAADLAAGTRAALVVICTDGHQSAVREALHSRRLRPSRSYVLVLGWPAPMPLDGLLTVDENGARSPRHRDVAAKRNLGLALARILGWRRILFVDDDIRRLAPAQIDSAAAELTGAGRLAAVGWFCHDIPDNSVVCHARRLAGLRQGTFLGGGALLLDVGAQLPMFPPVYNEDWLFLFDLVAARQVRDVGLVRQLHYNPFTFSERAREEEFGDTLAEGLFHLLHEGVVEPERADEWFWADTVRARRDLIRRTRIRLNASTGPRRTATASRLRMIAQAGRSLAAADQEHESLDLAPHLASYIRAWRADLAVWNQWFAGLGQVDDITQALEPLGIEPGQLIVV